MIATETDTPREDLGYRQTVPPIIQYARSLVEVIEKKCAAKTLEEMKHIERDGYREIHQQFSNRGLDEVLRREERFHG